MSSVVGCSRATGLHYHWPHEDRADHPLALLMGTSRQCG